MMISHSTDGHPASGLSTVQVARRFAGVRAVDGVDVTLGPGEVVGLIGPNGSGKSTLLNLLSGVVPPSSGRVQLDGVDITGWRAPRVARAGLSRTFQNILLFGDLTVVENVEVAFAFGAGVARRCRRDSARRALAELDLLSDAGRLARELPYGLQRRLEIARAVATGARFLLLDEPAAGMNEIESDSLLRTLSDISRARGTAMLVVDHDLRLIMRLCSRVVVLNEGQIIAAGAPEVVRGDPVVIEAYLGTSQSNTDGGST